MRLSRRLRPDAVGREAIEVRIMWLSHKLWSRIRSWAKTLLRRSRMESEMDAELRSHIEAYAEDLIRSGIPREQALRRARLEFGGIERVKEECRESRGIALVESLVQDLRFALRMLRKSPGFTAVAVLTLALGIGANTAIFSLIDGILMRALPVRDAQSLVVLKWSALKMPEIHDSTSYGDCTQKPERNGPSTSCSFSEPFFDDVASQTKAFSGVAAFAGGGQLDVSGNGAATVLDAEAVSGDYFPLLGIGAAAGRLIAPSDDSVSAPPVVVLAYSYWQTQFGGSASAIGKTIRLNNVPFTIIGVADASFDGLSPGAVRDAWVPISTLSQINPEPWVKNEATDVYDWWLVIIGRLKPGATRLQAQTEVSTLFRNEMLHSSPALSKPADDPKVAALPAQSGLTGKTTHLSTELYVLMMVVGIILLIACANVAGLLLSRAASRQKEMAVRLALGAGQPRIVRQLMTESVLLSLIGGALGILFTVWGTHAIVSLFGSSSDRPFGFTVGIDGRVLAFTFAIAVLTGIIFGLAPAFRGTHIDLTPALKDASASSGAEGRAARWLTLGNGLVVAQVALAVVVLVGAGLLVRTLQNLRSVDPGFDTRSLLTFRLEPALIGYKTPQIDAFYAHLQQRLAALPGVEAVSYSNDTLLNGGSWSTGFQLPGTPKNQNQETEVLAVGPDFFSAMHMHLLAGRNFTSTDFAQEEVADENAQKHLKLAEAVDTGILSRSAAESEIKAASSAAANQPSIAVVVNNAFVHEYFPNRNPLGQRFEWEESQRVIVGVVSDAKYVSLRSAIEPVMYFPSSGRNTTFELRTRSNPLALVSSVRSVVNQLDNNLPIFDVRTQTQIIDQLLSQERMIAKLSGFFGVLALVLACIGLYGLLSYEVSRRTREIGIRMALGAQQQDVIRLVIGQGTLLAMVGAAVGIGVALGVTRFLGSMLYGVHANDPGTIIGVAILLAVVALAACWIPARRAMKVDPMVALRHE
jgi:predicted permease